MAKKWLKVAAVATTVVMASSIAVGLTGCRTKFTAPEKRERTGWKDERVYTYNDYTAQMPSVWNELATNDGSNRDISGFINSAFFEYDFKFDKDGKIIPGDFEVEYSAATKLEDVTADYIGQYGISKTKVSLMVEVEDESEVPAGKTMYTAGEGADAYNFYWADAPEGYTEKVDDDGMHYFEVDPTNRAWKITLREDLVWDDGAAIKADEFVYSMSQQLSPNYLFPNASNYYSGNYVIHNAKNYLYQGQKGWFAASTALSLSDYNENLDSELIFTIGNATENAAYGGVVSGVRTKFGVPDGWTAAQFATYLTTNGINNVVDATVDQIAALHGKTLAAIKADPDLKATWDKVVGCWQTDPGEEIDFMAINYTFPEMDFSEVGYFVGNKPNELVIVMDNTLTPLDDAGNLAYQAAYNLSSFPLVKKSLWESLEVKTTSPWTNNYCTASVANSASWGPYKLTTYQAGTTYTLSRNENWYGYKMSKYDDQYQTDNIVVRYIPEWNTAWQAFQNGELVSIGMDVTIASDYKNSQQAYFTPTTRAYSLHLQSSQEALTKEKGNIMLKYDDFRKALSLALDRADYAANLTTSSLPLLGYLNSMYYYDVEHGGVYRETVYAKEALLRTYGATKSDDKWVVGGTTYDDIDDAVAALTGYNLTLARELVTKAYNEALEAGDITANDRITLTYGVDVESAAAERTKNWLENSFRAALVGTPLEGKLDVTYYHFNADTWAEEFIDRGAYDIAFGAWYNAPFNPYYLIGAYILKENRFALGWDPAATNMTLTIKDNDGNDQTITLNIQQWYDCLNGTSEDNPYNFALYPTDSRLQILAHIEQAILETYWSIPVYAGYGASIMSYKCDFITYEYNTFMEYGGIQYMSYNMDDTEWAAYVKKYGTLNYKI